MTDTKLVVKEVGTERTLQEVNLLIPFRQKCPHLAFSEASKYCSQPN